MTNKKKDKEILRYESPVLSRDISYDNRVFLVRIGIGLILFLCLIGFIFYIFSDDETDSSEYREPVLISSEGTFKERPENPEGAEIPHRDVRIYEQIEGKSDSEQFAGKVADGDPMPLTPEVLTDLNQLNEPKEVSSEPLEAEIKKEGEPAFVKEVPVKTVSENPEPVKQEPIKQEVKPKEKPAAKAAEKKKESKNTIEQALKEINPVAATGEKNKVVQLIALQSEDQAKIFMQNLKQKYSSKLKNISLNISSVTFPDKGTYYRVQSNLLTQEKAFELCTFMTSKKVDCIILSK